MSVITQFMHQLYKKTKDLNLENIFSQLEQNTQAALLDLGCDDGNLTLQYASLIGTTKLNGIEIISSAAQIAQSRGIHVYNCNLDDDWPIPDNSFDVIVANQIIEHVAHIDHFVSEIKRVLKKDGYAIISTENASSWHNIFASIMGWQIFSLTNVSALQSGIGNPLALHRNENPKAFSWTHKTIFNYRGLKELFEIHGFKVESYLGSGYHPFAPLLGKLDVRHSHYVSLKLLKNV